MHTHAEMIEDMWVFQGTPEGIFSDIKGAEAPGLVQYGDTRIEQVLSNILTRQGQPGSARLACSYRNSLASSGHKLGVHGGHSSGKRDATVSGPPWKLVAFNCRQSEWMGPTERLKKQKQPSFRMHWSIRLSYAAKLSGHLVLAKDTGLTDEEVYTMAAANANLTHMVLKLGMVRSKWPRRC